MARLANAPYYAHWLLAGTMWVRSSSGQWWIDIRTPGGQRVRQCARTQDRKAAQEYHDRLKADLWRVAKLGELPERSFEAAAVRFLQVSEGQKHYATKIRHVKYWREHFAGKTLRSLTSECILSALPTHKIRPDQISSKLTPATRNRYLSTITRLLNLCTEWGWLTQAPKIKKVKESTIRVRWITKEQARALVNALSCSWIHDTCTFALATGMRSGEIFSLQPTHLDLNRRLAWVSADRAKSSKARPIPLNNEALLILSKRMHTLQAPLNLLFTRASGEKLKRIDYRIFKQACAQIGLIDFRFHDLRHTWASWHVQQGTPLFALKELGGWENLEMVKKYAHLSPGHLGAYSNAVTFWSQVP